MQRNVVLANRLGWLVLALAFTAVCLPGCSNPYGYTQCGACTGEDSCCPAPPCEDYPKEAKPGESWCRILIPGETKTVCEEVCVECPSCRHEWVPPKIETKVHEVCVKPACCHEVRVPAVWQDLSECVEVCPGQFEQRCRRVCVTCESTQTVYEPAEYETCVEECQICPGHWNEVPVPPVKDRRCHVVCVKPPHWEWRRNPTCETPKPCAPAPCQPPPCAPPPCAPPPCAPPPCAPPPPKPVGLTALQVEMSDKDLTGAEQGIFSVGEDFLYVLTVANDEATRETPPLHVVFTLPKEMQFVSGQGRGITVTGAGTSATSSEFRLEHNQTATIEVRVRATSAPAGGLTKAEASVRTTGEVELSSETESTTLRGVPTTPVATR